MITTDTVIFPAFMASALVNGDFSGLEDAEKDWVEKAVKFCHPGQIVSASAGEGWFGHYCDIPGWSEDAVMMEYVVHTEE